MNRNIGFRVRTITALVAVAGALLYLGAAAGQAPRDAARADQEAEPLTRGPIHEAFAEPITFDPKPGPVVPKQPPEPVEELPPAEKPTGENVAWIPGYWHWDDERDDFIWVSGFWRAIPPGRQWVPGYFNRAQGGYRWVSGYWAAADAQAVDYLPEPPDNLESGPQGEAPSAQHVWTPGCWIWRDTRYLWRPGYWILGQPGWAWAPSHYLWTPSGYVFVDGHWDYAPARRGVLFAPVVFAAGIHRRPNYIFSPVIVIDTDIVVHHLFCRPRYHHYYFGDYYAASYLSAGIFPWFSFHLSREGYSPWFAYHRFHHGHRDRDWDDRLRDRYHRLRENEDARPPRTYQDQLKIAQRTREDPKAKELAVAKPLSQLAAEGGRESAIRLQKLDDRRRQEIQRQAKEFRQAVSERGKIEGAARPPADAESARKKPQRLNLPQSPVRGGREQPADRATPRTEAPQAPPAKPQDPKPDPEARPGTSKPARPPAQDRIEGRPRRDDQARPGAEPPKPPARPPASPPAKADPPEREARPPARPPSKPPSRPPSRPPSKPPEKKKDGKDG